MGLMVEGAGLETTEMRGMGKWRMGIIRRNDEQVMEAIALGRKGGNNEKVRTYRAEDGTLRMKILLRKEDFKQILAAAAAAEGTTNNTNKKELHKDSALSSKLRMMTTRMISAASSNEKKTKASSPSTTIPRRKSSSSSSNSRNKSIEQRLYDMMMSKKSNITNTNSSISRNMVRHHHLPISAPACNWSPALHTIPEDY